MSKFETDRPVLHGDHGQGLVVSDLGETVVVRFGPNVEVVDATELTLLRSIDQAIEDGHFDDSLPTLAKAQALAVRSVNDQWGVFSRSRVQLLPHQLWVCRQVTKNWPTRWLVADDVGLGKTIEAGLIMEPLISSGRVKSVLVLTPARLVEQWRARMKTMFGIRLHPYSSESDRGEVSYWQTANRVVASFHTLRMKKSRERLLQADPWDLVIVDEAHHFQAQEKNSTLTYSLLEELQEAGKIESLVLFTGTPHRGKDYGFLALMQLVRPDLFDPDRDVSDQLPDLSSAMIRNNKALVTDLEGKKLFNPVTTEAVDYVYSPEEAKFYETMSDFIIDGRTYALSLTGRQQTARMLLLIALQKLAASSIAAISSAFLRRRTALRQRLDEGPPKDGVEPETLDEAAEAEENRPDQVAIMLMKDEIERLDEILKLADTIDGETKVNQLVNLIQTRLPPDEPVLFFTEYKATQALVYQTLEAQFGKGCVGFINGEARLAIIDGKHGEKTIRSDREKAASDFNSGRTRFLISTEAGGEGIDLQHRCATLVHVDLPWNPMRLHQRVGRLNRYGQKRPVQVFLLRNPDTVEARIWQLLEEKLQKIQAALSASMEEAEDISQLVIGMTGSNFFDELYSEGAAGPSDRLTDWFDAKTMKLGGEDVVDAVRAIVGNVSRYDFQSAKGDIPKVDLPALEPFFRNAMQLFGRRVMKGDEGLSVATPEQWRGHPDFRDRYDDLVFDRSVPSEKGMIKLLGVGHPLIDGALNDCTEREALLARVDGLSSPLMIARAHDEITGTGSVVHEIILGVQKDSTGRTTFLRDWEVIDRLNGVKAEKDEPGPIEGEEISSLRDIEGELSNATRNLKLPFKRPRIMPVLALLGGGD